MGWIFGRGFDSRQVQSRGSGEKSPFPLFSTVAGGFTKTSRSLKKPSVLHFTPMMQHEMQHGNDPDDTMSPVSKALRLRGDSFIGRIMKKDASISENVPLHVYLYDFLLCYRFLLFTNIWRCVVPFQSLRVRVECELFS